MNRKPNFNVPNLLTACRIVIVPVVVMLLTVPEGRQILPRQSFLAFWLFVGASLTDLVDGYLARKWGMVTNLGKLLDPLADKLLVCAAMVMLIEANRLPAWVAVVVISREIGVTALRGAAVSEGMIIEASGLGKAKTLLLTIGVAALILHYPVLGLDRLTGRPDVVQLIGMGVLSAGLVLSAWSGIDYFARFVAEALRPLPANGERRAETGNRRRSTEESADGPAGDGSA